MKYKLKLISSHTDNHNGEYKYTYRGYELVAEYYGGATLIYENKYCEPTTRERQ